MPPRRDTAHRWGDVAGAHCCVQCYCEPDWPLASSPCPDAPSTPHGKNPKIAVAALATAKAAADQRLAEMPVKPPRWWAKRDSLLKHLTGKCVLVTKPNSNSLRTITAFGTTLTTQQWSEITGISHNAIDARYRRSWPGEMILGTPTPKIRRKLAR